MAKAKNKAKAKAKAAPKNGGLKAFTVVNSIHSSKAYPVYAAEKADWAPKKGGPVVGIIPKFARVKMDPKSDWCKKWQANGSIK